MPISLIKRKSINPLTKEDIYYPRWTRVSTVNETQLAKRMARGSTFSVGEVSGVMQDFPSHIIDELLDGNAITIAGLGTFKLKVSGKSQKEKKLVTSAGAKIAVLFEPDAELTSRLNNEKEFRFVEVPTEEGKQDAEEPEPGTTEPTGEEPSGETPGGNGGGGETPGGNGGNGGGGDTPGGGESE